MTGLVDSRTALRDITTQQSVYMQDVRLLPHALRHGEELVLSRWNMQAPKPTVSREQCKVVVAADGTAALVSCGRGPTLWRQSGAPWYAVSRSDTCPLSEGDQISLDCNDPEAAVFTCEVSSAAQQTFDQQDYAQEYAQQGYLFVTQVDLPAGWTTGDNQVRESEQGYAQDYVQGDAEQTYAQQGNAQSQCGLPAGWVAGVDEASGATYYYNAETGTSQWEPPS